MAVHSNIQNVCDYIYTGHNKNLGNKLLIVDYLRETYDNHTNSSMDFYAKNHFAKLAGCYQPHVLNKSTCQVLPEILGNIPKVMQWPTFLVKPCRKGFRNPISLVPISLSFPHITCSFSLPFLISYTIFETKFSQSKQFSQIHIYKWPIRRPVSSWAGTHESRLQSHASCWRLLAVSSASLRKTHRLPWKKQKKILL